jgi:hypothetical protein
MKRFAFVFGILAVGFAASTPARADWAVVRWDDGHCQIWGDAGSTPWGAGWTKIAVEPDWAQAEAAFDEAIKNRTCR